VYRIFHLPVSLAKPIQNSDIIAFKSRAALLPIGLREFARFLTPPIIVHLFSTARRFLASVSIPILLDAPVHVLG
jgi:hypothetical protein